jgi:hypothetical protein
MSVFSVILSAIFFALFYCVIIKLFSAFSATHINWRYLFILTMIAQTPSMIVKSIASIEIVYFYIPVLPMLSTIMGIGYLVFALRAAQFDLKST